MQCYLVSSILEFNLHSSIKSFLLATGPDMRTGAKGNWQSVCKPENEGGLGFRFLEEWNKAAMVKHIWDVCNKSDTLWVKWIHTFVIKNSCFWVMEIP